VRARGQTTSGWRRPGRRRAPWKEEGGWDEAGEGDGSGGWTLLGFHERRLGVGWVSGLRYFFSCGVPNEYFSLIGSNKT
jgi:hypothetical protein